MIGWILWGAVAVAEPTGWLPDDVAALREELVRAEQELALAEEPRPYHLRVKYRDLWQRSRVLHLGALVDASDGPARAFGVEVRVGDPSFDNGGIDGWQNGFLGREAPDRDGDLRLPAWLAFDAAYKTAVEQLSRARAQLVRPADHPGDTVLFPEDGDATWPLTAGNAGDPMPPAQRPDLRGHVDAGRALSAFPELLRAEVHVGDEWGQLVVLDSQDRVWRRPVSETSVRALVQAVTTDGDVVTDQRLWTGPDPSALPSPRAFADALTTLAEDTLAVAEAPALAEPYVGPVIFEGQAAAELFRWLLRPLVEGTPPPTPFSTAFGDLGDGTPVARSGRRVLPSGWRVADDPFATALGPEAYAVDAEGTPAQRVQLVEDGIVRRLLTSRTPRKEQPESTGHAAVSLWSRGEARATALTVAPSRAVSRARLIRQGLKAAASYGLDHVLVVRRLQHPALAGIGDPDRADRMAEVVLPPPVALWRVFADGREEVVRSARFTAVDRRALKDILAAGPSASLDVLFSIRGDDRMLSPIQGRVGSVRAPSVLIGELEIDPVSGDPVRARRLPPPRQIGTDREDAE